MTEQYQNFGETTLAEDLDNSETTVTVTDGSVFPSSGNFRVNCDDEIMLVTARSSNDLTVTRGHEGTSGASHTNGAVIKLVLTAGALTQIILEVATPSGTSFPAQPAFGNHRDYLRTDIRSGTKFYYDGTRWLSRDVYSVVGFASGITADSDNPYNAVPADHQIWIPRWHVMAYVTGAATWVVNLMTTDFDNAVVSLDTQSTSGNTASRMYHYTKTLGVVVDTDGANSTGNITGLLARWDEQSGTASFFGSVTVEYQLIAT